MKDYPEHWPNKLAWVAECRERNANSIRNTATGKWLEWACQVIVEQHGEIAEARNDQVDKTKLLMDVCEMLEQGVEPYAILIYAKGNNE